MNILYMSHILYFIDFQGHISSHISNSYVSVHLLLQQIMTWCFMFSILVEAKRIDCLTINRGSVLRVYISFFLKFTLHSFFKIFYLFIFRERGREGEGEGQKNLCVVASHLVPTGDLACKPGMCPDWNQTGNPLVHSPCSIH